MKPRFKLITSVYLILMRDNKILLSKRQNTGYEDGKYSFVAGHVDGDEPLTKALIREISEEAAIDISKSNPKLIHVMHRKGETTDNERMDFFLSIESYEGEIKNNEPHKCSEIDWFPLNNLPANTIPYIKKAIMHIQNEEFFSEFGWE